MVVGPITTLVTANPTLPAAIANNTYATVNAPRSNVLRPLEDMGLSSSPIVIILSFLLLSSSLLLLSNGEGITTESEVVPNEAPTAILLQNSIVAQINGIIPIINIIIVVVGSCCSICTAVADAAVATAVFSYSIVVVESIASVSCADCNGIVLDAIIDVESNNDDDGCSIIIIDLGCKKLLVHDARLDIAFVDDLLGVDEREDDDDGTNNVVLRGLLKATSPLLLVATHCFIRKDVMMTHRNNAIIR